MTIAASPIAALPIAAIPGASGTPLVQGLIMVDIMVATSYTPLLDALLVGDSVAQLVAHSLVDAIAVADAMANATRNNLALSDAYVYADVVIRLVQGPLADALVFAASPAQFSLTAQFLVDTLVAAGAVGTVLDALTVVATALLLASGASPAWRASGADSMVLSPAAATVLDALALAFAAPVFADVGAGEAAFMAVGNDASAFADTLSGKAAFAAALEDGAVFSLILGLNGAEYNGFVVNPYTGAVSTYTNYPFNSFAEFNGRFFGGSETGLMELVGATDNGTPINPVLRTGLMDFGSSLLKRVPFAYVGYTADQQLVMKVTVTAPGGEKQQYWYGLDPRPVAGATTQNRVQIDRGLRSVYWQFELTSLNGAQIDVDSLRLFPMILSRRV